MPNYYYTKEVVIGKNGEKIAFLMIDSCLLLCSNYTLQTGGYDHKTKKNMTLDELLMHPIFSEIKELRDESCKDPWYEAQGNKMMEWIQNTMKEWDKDEKIIWRASVQHHPLFAKWYADYSHLINDYLPILMKHKFDLYLNGHEHLLEYAFYPYSQIQGPDFLGLRQ